MANYPYMNYQQPVYNPYAQPYMPNVQPYVPQSIQQNISQPQQQPIQTQPTAQTQTPGFSGRYVTSKEEVVAAQIPFDGSASYFVNTSNGEIYSKAYNFSTGSAPVETYVKQVQQVQEQPIQSVNIPDYSPIFNAFGEQLTRMSGRIDELFERLDKKPATKSTPKKENE